MPRDREIELKLQLAEADLAILSRHPLLQSAWQNAKIEVSETTYFDTPDQKLRQKHLSLRIRRIGATRVLTLKQASASLVDRGEWAFETAADVPDIERLRDLPVGGLFAKTRIAAALAPVFTIHIERKVLPIQFNGADIEGALDQGWIEAGDGRQPILEFELECKSGPPRAIFDMAGELMRATPLALAILSKAERGYAMTRDADAQPKATRPALTRKMTPRAALCAIGNACLRDILRKQPNVGPR